METELVLTRGGLPPLSARGCTQELSPVALGQFQRTLDGELVFLGIEGKKYHSVVTCEDQETIAIDDLMPGIEVGVSCIQRLWHKAIGGFAVLERDPVVGSVFATDHERQPVPILQQNNREISLSTTDIAYICYRPILRMRVITYMLTTHEWQKKGGWRLELEEI